MRMKNHRNQKTGKKVKGTKIFYKLGIITVAAIFVIVVLFFWISPRQNEDVLVKNFR